MANCDICGMKVEKTIEIMTENTKMNVCKGCAGYGQKLEANNFKKSFNKRKSYKKEEDERIVSNYSALVKNAREKMNLKQDDLAKKIAERSSLIHQIESGHINPQIKTVKKLEKFLKIKLIEKTPQKVEYEVKKTESEGLTIGDLIKKKN